MSRPLRQHFFLFRELVKRDFLGRYAGSLFGLVWSFAQPLWMLLLFGFVFGTVLKVPLIGEPTQSFGVFVFCGLLPWTAVHEGLMRSATAVTDNANLVKKVRFPSQILVLTVVATAMVHQLIGLCLFILYLLVRGELAWSSLLWLAFAIPMQAALTVGLGLTVATLQVFFRDTVQVLSLVLSAWFYLTPIVYPIQLVPPGARPWIEWNPSAALVDLYRRALLGSSSEITKTALVLVVSAALALGVGYLLFTRNRAGFADEI